MQGEPITTRDPVVVKRGDRIVLFCSYSSPTEAQRMIDDLTDFMGPGIEFMVVDAVNNVVLVPGERHVATAAH